MRLNRIIMWVKWGFQRQIYYSYDIGSDGAGYWAKIRVMRNGALKVLDCGIFD